MFGIFVTGITLDQVSMIKDNTSTIDSLPGQRRLVRAQKTLVSKIPQIKYKKTFYRRLSDIFESNPRGGSFFWRDEKVRSVKDGASYGFSFNWFFPVRRLRSVDCTVENELNLDY
jgi:hypothetical protein